MRAIMLHQCGRRMRRSIAIGLLFAAQLLIADARANDNPLKLPSEAVKNHGTLIIVGGGNTPQEAKDEFLRLAGGRQARIVLVPSAYDYGGADVARRRYLGWLGKGTSLDVVDTKSLTVEEARRFETTLDAA